jgi:ribonuclease HI
VRSEYQEQIEGMTQIYTDGSLANGQAGWGFFKDNHDDSRNDCGRVVGAQEVIRGELLAILWALYSEPEVEDVCIWVDSDASLKTIKKGTSPYTKSNITNNENWDITSKILGITDTRSQRGAITHFRKVDAHKGIYGNEMADELAKKGSLMPNHASASNIHFWDGEKQISGKRGRKKMIERGYDQIGDSTYEHWMLRKPEVPFDQKASSAYMDSKSGITAYNKLKIFKIRHSTYGFQNRLHRIGLAPSPMCLLCRASNETATHVLCGCPYGEYPGMRNNRHNRCCAIVIAAVKKNLPRLQVWSGEVPFPTELIPAGTVFEGFKERPKPDAVFLDQKKKSPKYPKGKVTIWEFKAVSENRCIHRRKEAEEKYTPIISMLNKLGYEATLVITVTTALGYILETTCGELSALGLKTLATKQVIAALHLQLAEDILTFATYRWSAINKK